MEASLRVNRSGDADGGDAGDERGSLTGGLGSIEEEGRVQSDDDGGLPMLRVPLPPSSSSSSGLTDGLAQLDVLARSPMQALMQGTSQLLAAGMTAGHWLASEEAAAPMLIALLVVASLLALTLVNLPRHACRKALGSIRSSCMGCHPSKWGGEGWMHEGWRRGRGARWTKVDTLSGPACPDKANAHWCSHPVRLVNGCAAEHAAAHAAAHHTTAEGRGVLGDGEGNGESNDANPAVYEAKPSAPPLGGRGKTALVRAQIPKHATPHSKPRLPSALASPRSAAIAATVPPLITSSTPPPHFCDTAKATGQTNPRHRSVAGPLIWFASPATDPLPRGSELHGKPNEVPEDEAGLLLAPPDKVRADETEI